MLAAPASGTGNQIKVGERVRVKSWVTTPKYKWGSVTHDSVGIVTQINSNGRDIFVDFPQQLNWTGLISEMEVVPTFHPGVTCCGCQMTPIAGPRFKCKVRNYIMKINGFLLLYLNVRCALTSISVRNAFFISKATSTIFIDFLNLEVPLFLLENQEILM